MALGALQTVRSLRQALPIVARHLSAYLELVEQDLTALREEVTARLKALMLVAAGGLLSVLMICLLVVALTWDSAARLPAIGIMCGVFILTTAAAVFYLTTRSSNIVFPSVQSAWQQDKVIVQRLLADDHSDRSTVDA
jgi:uncharacterized membrane protein YqjE